MRNIESDGVGVLRIGDSSSKGVIRWIAGKESGGRFTDRLLKP